VRGDDIAAAAPCFLRDIAFSLPALPLTVMTENVSVTSQGVHLHLAGRNVRPG